MPCAIGDNPCRGVPAATPVNNSSNANLQTPLVIPPDAWFIEVDGQTLAVLRPPVAIPIVKTPEPSGAIALFLFAIFAVLYFAKAKPHKRKYFIS